MGVLQKNFDDVSDVLSEQIELLSNKKVTQEQRKNAQVLSRLVGVYVSLSVHKMEYDTGKKEGTPRIPAFESRKPKSK